MCLVHSALEVAAGVLQSRLWFPKGLLGGLLKGMFVHLESGASGKTMLR